MTTTIKHYALIGDNNIVQDIMVTDENYIQTVPGRWLETTHGAFRGHVYDVNGVTDIPVVRQNYAGVGYTYDPEHDVFIRPKPHDGAVLNKNYWDWDDIPSTSLEEIINQG
jgi:hypothetical protein